MAVDRSFFRHSSLLPAVKIALEKFLNLFDAKAYLQTQAAPAAKTTTTTLTAAELLGRLLTANQGGAAAASYTLPLATDLEVALRTLVGAPNLSADDSFDFTIINLSVVAAEDVTVLTNTGWTLVGKMTVESNDAVTSDARGTFRVRRTALNAYTLYRIA